MQTRETILMEFAEVDPSKLIFDGIDTSGGPRWSTAEVAKVFFARTAHWMRWREQRGHFFLDGVEVTPERKPSGVRSYTLADVERLAHALAGHNAISASQLAMAIRMLALSGEMYELI